ncbi:hypothetical protein [Rhizobium sp. CCGE 510]|uniref:hypothetical protein n=1 Tax=Rhizobium sp. CCGE 510 TaxID=1132836 RepID=UPI0012F630F8|nr:hypothetical protein [Rhizobium sp. CCGE 510]
MKPLYLPVHSNTAPEGTGTKFRCRDRIHAATFIGIPCQAGGQSSFSTDQPERNITLTFPGGLALNVWPLKAQNIPARNSHVTAQIRRVLEKTEAQSSVTNGTNQSPCRRGS